ncbi:MAG: hypothetical protein KatS3mg052_1274 [Candidatus Roseilinea sp.]|nr:MAG: hypothetical protein KatS3mg052_1274 [Candidatus Roseilinea sp.]
MEIRQKPAWPDLADPDLCPNLCLHRKPIHKTRICYLRWYNAIRLIGFYS